MEPAPVEWALAEAPPAHMRKMMSMVMFLLMAERTEKTTNMLNDIRYIVRRPNSSEKDDHQRGKMAMEIM